MKNFVLLAHSVLIAIFLFMPHYLGAAVFTDISGVYTDLGDEGSTAGAGISFLWDMPRYFGSYNSLFYINSTFTYGVKNKNEPDETILLYFPISIGLEYRYQIMKIPLYITGSAGAGVSFFEKDGPVYNGPFIDASRTQIDSAFGPYGNIMLGLNYVISQHTALFAKAGYQMSMYNKKNIESPMGFSYIIGLRVPISGSLKTFD